jgi:hypothetical protein
VVGGYHRSKEAAQCLLLYLFVPVLIAYLISLKVLFFNSRHLSAVFPFYISFVALGLDSFKNNYLKRGLIAGLILMFSFSLYHLYFNKKHDVEPWKDVVRYVEEQSGPGDVIFLYEPHMINPWKHYYKGGLKYEPLFLIDEDNTEKSVVAAIKRKAGKSNRVLFVLSHDNSMKGYYAELLARHYRLLGKKEFNLIKVFVFDA